MKKHILALIFLLACALPTLAQTGVQYQGTVNTKVINRGLTGADSGLVITPSDTFNKSLPVGTIRFLTDLSGYVFTGSYWKYINAPNLTPYMRYVDTAAMLSPYLRKGDTASLSTRINAKQATLVSGTNIKTINGTSLLGSGDIIISGGGGATDTTSLSTRIDARVKYTDTAAMLVNYVRAPRLSDTAAAIRSAIPSVTGKLNISDTATMLSPYARKTLVADTAAAIRAAFPSVSGKLNTSDTTAMLANYLRKTDTSTLSSRINLKVNIADTATMLSKYLRKTDTTAMLANYYRTASATSALALKANIAAPTFTGTVSMPPPNITSLSSGTTNDSLLVADPSTGAVRRISSARIGGGGGGGISGSGTTAYVPRFTGSTAVGNSVIQDDGTNIGVGGSPYLMKIRSYGPIGIANSAFADITDPAGASLSMGHNGTFGFVKSWASTPLCLISNASIGIGTTTPSVRAELEVSSTTRGLLPPRLTTSQRNAQTWGAGENGMLIICTDCTAADGSTGVLQMYQHTTTSWKNAF